MMRQDRFTEGAQEVAAGGDQLVRKARAMVVAVVALALPRPGRPEGTAATAGHAKKHEITKRTSR